MNALRDLALASKAAGRKLAQIESCAKENFLVKLSQSLSTQQEFILEANRIDVENALSAGATKAFIDRLTLNSARIHGLSLATQKVAELPDPTGRILESRTLDNGLKITKITVPFGSILMVYESRPNVTIDAACLGIKSGNAIILKGGKEAIHTNQIFHEIMTSCLAQAGLPQAAISLLRDPERTSLYEMLKYDDLIDLVIPRGGEELVRAISENSRIPVLKNSKGLCHTFVDESADIQMALEICDNAKTQRPGVCNAMETLLVHKQIAKAFLPALTALMEERCVELRGDVAAREVSPSMKVARAEDWDEEYSDLILAVRVVDSLDQALEHIAQHGSGHSEAIVSNSPPNQKRFLNEVDAAAVYTNASTRFTDGGEFGLGAEIGISTGKLHARGPMGLSELTTYKYLIEGSGQTRI